MPELIVVSQPSSTVNIFSNKGLTGNTGQQGIQGAKGDTGAASTIAGPTGPPGGPTTQYKGTWGALITYVSGDTVTYAGNLYWLESSVGWTVGSIPPAGGFTILLAKGATGATGAAGTNGGITMIGEATDVLFTNKADDDFLKYNLGSSKWVNIPKVDGGNF
jgi:hypothetical protein